MLPNKQWMHPTTNKIKPWPKTQWSLSSLKHDNKYGWSTLLNWLGWIDFASEPNCWLRNSPSTPNSSQSSQNQNSIMNNNNGSFFVRLIFLYSFWGLHVIFRVYMTLLLHACISNCSLTYAWWNKVYMLVDICSNGLLQSTDDLIMLYWCILSSMYHYSSFNPLFISNGTLQIIF